MNAFEDCGPAQAGGSSDPSGGAAFTVPLGLAQSGRLIFAGGAVGVDLLAEPALPALLRGRLARPMAWIGFEAGIVMVRTGTGAPFPMAPPGKSAAQRRPIFGPHDAGGDVITLNASIPWSIEFRGDAYRVTARLGGLQLQSLDVLGKVGRVCLELPRPSGTGYLYLAGEADRVTVRRPAGVGIGINAQGGLSRLTLDGQAFASLERNSRRETPGLDRSSGRYELSLASRGSRVTIEPLNDRSGDKGCYENHF